MSVPVEINDLATIGAVRDTPPYLLPPEAFGIALNMRAVDGGMERLLGWEQVFGTPGVAPHFLMPVRTASSTFWLYTSLTQAYGFDGITHTNITRAAGATPYTASETRQWNGTLLGGIPIINNGNDVPQFWSPVALGTDLQDLTNWPATLRAKVVRAFGAFLVAINITKSGNTSPHMVKWSHPADPGTVPSSWDETDPTKDTGEIELPDVQAGLLVEALPLSDTMYLFKEGSVWKMRFVGGRFIFDFGKAAWLPTTGILAPRCVTITGDGTKQVWASQDDILWHDGNRVRSILDKRQRSRLFNEIDTVSYLNCFMFTNAPYSEVWFCYPSAGQTHPNRALVMNYASGDVWPITEVNGITFRNAAAGPIEGASGATWNSLTEAWDDDESPWSQVERRKLVLAGTDETMFFAADTGSTRNGVVFTGTLQREGLSLLGKKRNGEWIVDFNRYKMADMVWPKVQGGPVDIRLGSQELVDGPVTWSTAVSFDPATEVFEYAGPRTGRALAIEFSASVGWRIDGYRFEVVDLSTF